MSGFVGVLGMEGGAIDHALLARLTEAMSYRGPDAQDTWSDAEGRVGLGHALFRTTVDSAREAQPCSLDGEVWIAADARIDGRAALVRRLGEQGQAVAADRSDAELVLHAYAAWGDACLDHLIGDFAFVLWDGRRQRLLAARDQFGVAQLFHTQVGGTLLIGNTLTSLLAHPGVATDLDEQTVADLALFTMHVDDTATGYAAIRRLPAGHTLVWDGRGPRIERYWSPRPPPAIRYRQAQDYVEHFRLLFDEAVGDRLRTDRAGCQVSGGMDSTSIAVTMHRLGRGNGAPFDLQGYTVDHQSLIPDQEAVLAVEVGGHAGFAVEVVDGGTGLGDGPAGDRAWVPPEPGVTTIPGMGEVCQRAAGFGRVLLAGYGGDPLLTAPTLSWRRAGASLRRGQWKWPARQGLAAMRRARRRGARAPVEHRDPLPPWVDRNWANRMDLPDRMALYRERSRREQIGMAEAPLWRTLFAWSDPGYHGLPLDIRFPFFDVRLLEYVLAIPPVPWLEGKWLLREAMADRLPESVRMRPKTPMAGDAALARNERDGVPPWELDALAAPEMSAYVDGDWLRSVRAQPAAEQARTWAMHRPPVHLATWFQRRSSIDKGEWHAANVR